MRMILLAVSAMSFLLGCASPPAPRTADAAPMKRIAIATAFAPELAALLPSLEDQSVVRINGKAFYTGAMAGQDVVLFETGVSIVNAAMNTQLLFDHFTVDALVVSGIAGGVDPSLSIGDVTIPARWGQYNEMIFMRETAPGTYVPYTGVEPEFPNFLFMGPRGVRIASADTPSPERRFWFDADPALLRIAERAAERVTLNGCIEEQSCLDEQPEVVVGGNGVSGSIFLDNAAYREYLFETFDAQVAEMETAAIAMVAHANDVPYVAFRSLSDLAGGGTAGQNEMNIFGPLAAENAATLVLSFLTVYGEGLMPEMRAEAPFCEINFATMPLYSDGPLTDDQLDALLSVHENPEEERRFISSFNDVTMEIVRTAAGGEGPADFDIANVWGGYLGTTSPSLAGRFPIDTPADQALAARIGAAIGYVYLQDSVLVQCTPLAAGGTVPAFELSEAGGDAIHQGTLRSVYGMMMGEADGRVDMGYTYDPTTDSFVVLGFIDGGALERDVLSRVTSRLERLSGHDVGMVERPRWVQFPANDWTAKPDGVDYVSNYGLSDIRDELDRLQADYIAEVEALSQPSQ